MTNVETYLGESFSLQGVKRMVLFSRLVGHAVAAGAFAPGEESPGFAGQDAG